jgi:hypothetical protein
MEYLVLIQDVGWRRNPCEDPGCYRIITDFPQVKHSAYSGDET